MDTGRRLALGGGEGGGEGRIERSGRNSSLINISQIARALDVDIRALFEF